MAAVGLLFDTLKEQVLFSKTLKTGIYQEKSVCIATK
jgi:hypothetical protein